MKKKDIKELHQKTEDELVKMLKEAGQDLMKARLDNTQKKLKNTRMLFHLRKYIARGQTILREKEMVKNV